MFVGADQFFEFFRPVFFVMYINQIIANVHTTFGNFIFETVFVALLLRDVVLKCCSGRTFLHCALFISSVC